MADHFDIVPVRTNHEGRKVFPAVVRAQARRAIVLATRFERRAMESFDLLAVLGDERQVKMRRLLVSREEAQRRLAIRAELDAKRPLRHYGHADRRERLEEERLARCVIADAEDDVVNISSPEACDLRKTQRVRWNELLDTATPADKLRRVNHDTDCRSDHKRKHNVGHGPDQT